METSGTRDEQIESVTEAEADDDRLVSIAVPHDAPIGEYLEYVEEKHAEAEYLDESVSEPLRAALERAVRVLHDVEETPEDGLVLYTGVLDGDLQHVLFTDPPGRVTEGVFEHGNEFVTEPLADHGGATPTVGLVVVERGGAAVGRLDGAGVHVLDSIDSEVPGKTRAGGQSADQFRRRREERKREFFDEVGEVAAHEFDHPDAVVLGGTHVTVEAFRDADALPDRLAERLVETYAVEHAGERGLEQLASKARGDVTNVHPEARDALDEFFDRLPDGEVTYGRGSVDDALTYDAVATLLVAESVDAAERETYVERVENEGGEAIVIPSALERGQRFASAFDGIGALLRFPVE